jgi:hypothetical protein
MTNFYFNAAGRLRSMGLSAAFGVLLIPLASCHTDEVLKVVDPAVATPGSLTSLGSVPTVYAGALGDFYSAYSGNSLNDAYTVTSGAFTDELKSSDTFTTRNDADRRTQTSPANGNLSDIPYVAIQRARRSNEAAARAIAEFFPATDPRIAETTSLAGYTYITLGEGFCSGTPVPSSLTAQDFAESPGITTAAMFDTAIARFQAAIAGLGTATDAATVRQRNLANIGLARALVNNAQYTAAATAVAGIPDVYVYFNDHSINTAREFNSTWALQDNGRWTLPEVEGVNGINWQTANDPRVPWMDAAVNGFDKANRLFKQVKWTSQAGDVPLATGAEARLIEAEAALSTGDATTWLAKLNGLRAQVRTLMLAYTNPGTYAANNPNAFVTATTLAPLADPGTAAARVDLTFRERAFWMYLTGHRLGDLRRLIRQYGRSAEAVFPTGTWHKGGPYGTDVALLDAFTETNNSLFVAADCKANVP